jgi:hypothetical protein
MVQITHKVEEDARGNQADYGKTRQPDKQQAVGRMKQR